MVNFNECVVVVDKSVIIRMVSINSFFDLVLLILVKSGGIIYLLIVIM